MGLSKGLYSKISYFCLMGKRKETKNELKRYDENLIGGVLREVKARGHKFYNFRGGLGRNFSYYKGIHNLFLKFVGDPKGKSVLHLGAGTSLYTRFLQGHGANAVSFDVAKDAVEISKKVDAKNIVQGDARVNETRSLPFKDASFDVFVSDHFLFSRFEEFEGSKKDTRASENALGELSRVLKPGGIGIIYRYQKHDSSIAKRIEKLGFEIVKRNRAIFTRDNSLILRKK